MSTDTETIRVYFPADIPKNQAEILVSLITGRDDDLLLAIEGVVNRRIEHAAAYDPDWMPFYEKVEFDAPVIHEFGRHGDFTLLEDIIDEVTA